MFRNFKRLFIGNRAFYSAVLALIIPVIIQNTISNFVNLLDNLMVGAVGQNQMNGVSISNQLVFVFNLTVFGGMSGATIFAAQFFGAKDDNGVRHCFRYAMWVAAIVSLLGILILGGFRDKLLGLYINAADTAEDILNASETLKAGASYISIMLPGLIPFAVTNAYASVLRVTGETKLPMIASVVSVLLNLVGNWILIFGRLGLPQLGATGAAISTTVSRYVEMLIIVVAAHVRQRRKGEFSFLKGAYASLRIPLELLRSIFIKGAPLLLNEFVWSMGIAILSRQYSLRGLDVVAAVNINSTINNIFNVLFFSMGTAASVLVGNALGADDFEGAKSTARKVIAFSEMLCIATSVLLFIASGILPNLYTQATQNARSIATDLIRVWACVVPMCGFLHCTYFILRAGGKTMITFFFDAVYTWVLPVPVAWFLAVHTSLDVVAMYAIVNMVDLVKVVLGYVLLKKGVWIHNIVSKA